MTMGVKSLGTDLPTLEYAAHPSHLSVEYKHALVRVPNPLASQTGNLSSPSQVPQPLWVGELDTLARNVVACKPAP